MQLFHFIAAWLFPGAAVSKVATKAAIAAESMEHDNASSSLAFSVKAVDDSGSSVSSSSSSSSDGHPRFFPSRQQEHSPPASPLCFGAGRGGVGRLLLLRGSRGARARSPPKQETAAGVAQAAANNNKQHGDAVGRSYLRRISRRLRKARRVSADDQVSPPSPSWRAPADDTAREREEAVARAIAYCKDTLRRGVAPPPPPPPRPPPSPSLDDWLHDRQEEIIASAAACCDDGSTDSHTPSPPPRLVGGSLAAHTGVIERGVSHPLLPPRAVHRDGELAEMEQPTGKQAKESTCSALPSRDGSVASIDVVHDKELPPLGHDALDTECRGESATMAETATSSSPSDLAADELRMGSSFDEMELLNIFDGDEEMIGRHFITIQI